MRKLTLLLLLNCNNVKDLNRSNKVINELKVINFINSKKLKDLIQDLDETSQEQLKLLENDDLIGLKEDGNNIIYIMVKENKTKALSYFCEYLKNEGKIKELKDLILATNEKGESSISLAIKKNSKEAFYILSQYIDKNDKIDINGNNIIMKAISATKKDTKDDILASILKQELTKEDMEYRNKDDDNILSLAIKHIIERQTQELDQTSLLIKTDEESSIEQTEEVTEGNLAKILNLYNKYFDVNHLFTYDGKTKNALTLAIEHGNKIAAKLLMELKANPLLHLEDEEGNTPLALSLDKIGVMKAILENHRHLIDQPINNNGDTLLILASKSENKLISILEYNKEANLDINFYKKNNLGEDALYTSFKKNNLKGSKLLIEEGINVNEYLKDERLIVDIASLGNKEAIRTLLGNGARFDSTTKRALKKVGKSIELLLLNVLEGGANFFGVPVDLKEPANELFPSSKKQLTKEQITFANRLIKEVISEGSWLLEMDKRPDKYTFYAYKYMLRSLKKSLIIIKNDIESRIKDYNSTIATRNANEKLMLLKHIRKIDDYDLTNLEEIVSIIDHIIEKRKSLKQLFKNIRESYFENPILGVTTTILDNSVKSIKSLAGVKSERTPLKNFEKFKSLNETSLNKFYEDFKKMASDYMELHYYILRTKYSYRILDSEIQKLIKKPFQYFSE